MAFAGGFDSSWKIRERGVIDFEGNRLETMSRIAKRHFAGVAEKAEPSYIGNGMDGLRGLRLLVELLQGRSCSGIESAHRGDDGCERFRGGAIFFQSRGNHAGSQGLCEEQHIAGLCSHIAPDALWVNQASDRVAKEHVLVAN